MYEQTSEEWIESEAKRLGILTENEEKALHKKKI